MGADHVCATTACFEDFACVSPSLPVPLPVRTLRVFSRCAAHVLSFILIVQFEWLCLLHTLRVRIRDLGPTSVVSIQSVAAHYIGQSRNHYMH